ncbi:MAG: hypothetical protein SFX72_03640 [Isosphaeraceae bacterium]|nr:hypothetical protein [Isosphaeraceae bacterium]
MARNQSLGRRLAPVSAAVLWMFAALGSISSQAQIVTVSGRPVEAWIVEARALTRAVMPPALADQILPVVEAATAADKLEGLDRTRPWGGFADLPAAGEAPLVAVAFPVTDAARFLETLKGLGLGVDPQPARPGFRSFTHVVTLPDGATRFYVFPTEGKYLFFSMFPGRPERFEKLDLAQLDRARPKSSSLTVSARLDRVPVELRNQFLSSFDEAVKRMSERNPGENDAAFLGRKVGQDLTASLFRTLAREGREVAVDFELDSANGPIALEVRVSGTEGSGLDAAITGIEKQRSRFSDASGESIFESHFAARLPKSLRDAMVELARMSEAGVEKEAKNDEERRIAKAIANWTIKTLAADSTEMLLALRGPFAVEGEPKRDRHALVAAMHIEDPAVLEALIRDSAGKQGAILDIAKGPDGRGSIHKLGSSTGDAAAEGLFGRLDVFLAIRDDLAWMAVGEPGIAALRKAMEESAAPAPASGSPVAVTLEIGRLMRAIPAQGGDPNIARAARAVFEEATLAKNRLQLTMQAKEKVLRIRLASDVVLLRSIMALGMAIQGPARP